MTELPAGEAKNPISGSEGGVASAGLKQTGKKKRTGATRQHYERQKGTAFAYFRVNTQDAGRMAGSQFTIYNFITNSFAYSPNRKELTLKLLESLKREPKKFSQLVVELGAPKGTLYLLCLSLTRSGLVAKNTDDSYSLSTGFSDALRAYASWWEGWAKGAPLQRLK